MAANQSQRAKLAYDEEDIPGRKYVLRAAPLLQLTKNHHGGGIAWGDLAAKTAFCYIL